MSFSMILLPRLVTAVLLILTILFCCFGLIFLKRNEVLKHIYNGEMAFLFSLMLAAILIYFICFGMKPHHGM